MAKGGSDRSKSLQGGLISLAGSTCRVGRHYLCSWLENLEDRMNTLLLGDMKPSLSVCVQVSACHLTGRLTSHQ